LAYSNYGYFSDKDVVKEKHFNF